MHVTENQLINSVNSHINAIKHMHDLTVNFQKMLQITNPTLAQSMQRRQFLRNEYSRSCSTGTPTVKRIYLYIFWIVMLQND
jgi:hypothetical protein